MKIFEEWRAARKFLKVAPENRKIVFYSEGPHYWTHFEAMVENLTAGLGQTLCYVSSSADDPGLGQDNPRIIPFNVGFGLARTYFFSAMDQGLMVMTLTDLDNLQIRRSRYPVHYAYVFHSLVSIHMIYRTHAFDHYDSFLCCGPHQMAEIRAMEALHGLPRRPLFEHGYGRLDSLLAANQDGPPAGQGGSARVLVAPSWGPQGLFESGLGVDLVGVLLEAGFQVRVRPHPQTVSLDPGCWRRLIERHGEHPGFAHEEDMGKQDSLHWSDIMVGDWSGAALEYAFSRERPVLFVDLPRKVNNPEYSRLEQVPLEVSIRREIGAILPADALGQAPGLIRSLLETPGAFAARARAARQKWVFNVGRSGRRGAEIILELAAR